MYIMSSNQQSSDRLLSESLIHTPLRNCNKHYILILVWKLTILLDNEMPHYMANSKKCIMFESGIATDDLDAQ